MAVSAVQLNIPEVPYPADTYVRGWKFTIDHERLMCSDTWALAPPDMRPWLLLLWLIAWTQRPAGSLSNNHEVIAAKIGMDPRIFSAHADILLRGFVRHQDGRLYHPVIVEQVLGMMAQRRNEADRKALARKQKGNVPPESHGTPTGLHRESTRNPAPEPVPVPEPVFTQPTSFLRSSSEKTAAESAKTPRVSARSPPPPFREIRELWAEILPELPQPIDPEAWTDARKTQIRARWNNELPDLETWRALFEDIRRSPFLMGKTQPRNGGRVFRADLFWITKPENLLKFMEGRYDA